MQIVPNFIFNFFLYFVLNSALVLNHPVHVEEVYKRQSEKKKTKKTQKETAG